jgi:toxin ParE1/3/4
VHDDLHEIADFVAKDSSLRASAAIGRILEAGRSLQQLPWRGRVVPELHRDDHRELFVHEYRLIYRIEDQIVQILAVIHGRRLLGRTRLGPEASKNE